MTTSNTTPGTTPGVSPLKKCRRKACTNFRASRALGYCKKHAYALGVFKPFVDSHKAISIINNLHDQGYTYRTIARAANITEGGIFSILRQGRPTVRGYVYEGLVCAQRELTPESTPSYFTPAWPATRRLQALAAAGHTTTEICNATGMGRNAISELRLGIRTQMKRTNMEAIREYYATHEATPMRPADARLARNNWPGPFDWDDIDNPDENPGTDTPTSIHERVDVTEELLDKLTHITKQHGSINAAANHLRMSSSDLMDIVKKKRPTITTYIYNKISDHHDDINVGAFHQLRPTG